MEMPTIQFIGGEEPGELGRCCPFAFFYLFLFYERHFASIKVFTKNVYFSGDSCKRPLKTYYEIHIVYRVPEILS